MVTAACHDPVATAPKRRPGRPARVLCALSRAPRGQAALAAQVTRNKRGPAEPTAVDAPQPDQDPARSGGRGHGCTI